MNTSLKRVSFLVAAAAATFGISTPASADFRATICNDIQCTGGDDFVIVDNGAGDTLATTGAISFAQAAFGYTIVVNTSQSKPVVGSASSPQLDLSYTVTSPGPVATSVFLNISDTGFTAAPGNFTFTIGGTNSGGDGSVTGRAWGGTNNTALTFSGANLFSTLGAFTTPSYSATATGSFNPTVNPYSLTIGMAISRSTAGTSTGDLNVQISAVPEPSTWAMMLIGPALMGVVVQRRRRRR